MLTVGFGLVEMETVFVFTQPVTVFVPLTVYVVVDVFGGKTKTKEPVRLPGIVVYVFAPLDVIVAEEPLHIFGLEAVAFITGKLLTVTATVDVL